MKCPVCQIELIVVERQRIEIDYCIQCQGFWFDAGEIELLVQGLGMSNRLPDLFSLPRESSLERPRRCPRCRRAMDKIRLGKPASIVVDRCPQKEGFWFDKGELGRVLEEYRGTPSDGTGMLVHFLGEVFPR